MGVGIEEDDIAAGVLEDARHVATPIAIVGCRPHCHERVVEHVLVPFHNELVRAGDEVDAIRRIELGNDIAPEGGTPRRAGSAPSRRCLQGRTTSGRTSPRREAPPVCDR